MREMVVTDTAPPYPFPAMEPGEALAAWRAVRADACEAQVHRRIQTSASSGA